MKRSVLAWLSVFVIASMVLAACGGSDNKPAGDPSTTNTTGCCAEAAARCT